MAAGTRQNRTRARFCTKKYAQIVACTLAFCLLTACQPHPEDLLTDYSTRLHRVLAVDIIAPAKPELASIPEIRALIVDIPAVSIELSDMLSLDTCDLETLVAERNSSLGKVQTDASLLQYELRLLSKLTACLQQPGLMSELDPDLQAKLQDILLIKQQTLPDVLRNLLSREPTLRQQLSGNHRGLQTDQGGITETREALKQLNLLRQLILQQDFQAASQIDINQALGVLHRSQLLADLQHSLRLSDHFFRQLNLQLSEVSADKLCNTDKTVRENLLLQIFIGRVQTELARVDGVALQLVPELLNLYQHHPLAAVVQQRLQQPQLGLQQQLRQHVNFWQRWRQCDKPR